jgi:argininosuccinate synthase
MKAMLAYSGSVKGTLCIHWLREERNLEVLTFAADLGFGETLETLGEHAVEAGAQGAHISDLKEHFLERYALRALRASASYEEGGLLSTPLGRAVVVEELVKLALENDCEYVAHGCTGRANDHIRFEASIAALAPELKVLAPVREAGLDTPQGRTRFVKRLGIDLPSPDRHVSIDGNLWGVCLESEPLDDLDVRPDESIYRMTVAPQRAPDRAERVSVEFKKGHPAALDGETMSFLKLVDTLNRLGGRHGVGRLDVVEDRVIGMKTREIYEAPAATILHRAHRALEDLVLSKELREYKYRVGWKYGELVYSGLWFTQLRSAFDAFVDVTQEYVDGTVVLELYKGRCSVVGRTAPHSLYELGREVYGRAKTFDHASAEGFSRIWSRAPRMEALRRLRKGSSD